MSLKSNILTNLKRLIWFTENNGLFMTTILFNFCNSLILLILGMVLFFPKQKITARLIAYPWIPLCLSFFYLYFIIVSGGITEADFSSLEGIVVLFQKATPESAAAGWLHYLAFDFWMGAWIIKHSQKQGIKHLFVVIPLVFTFMLGPVGILIYSLFLFGRKAFIQAK